MCLVRRCSITGTPYGRVIFGYLRLSRERLHTDFYRGDVGDATFDWTHARAITHYIIIRILVLCQRSKSLVRKKNMQIGHCRAMRYRRVLLSNYNNNNNKITQYCVEDIKKNDTKSLMGGNMFWKTLPL